MSYKLAEFLGPRLAEQLSVPFDPQMNDPYEIDQLRINLSKAYRNLVKTRKKLISLKTRSLVLRRYQQEKSVMRLLKKINHDS